jgi:lysophospholipase L1-like esterase
MPKLSEDPVHLSDAGYDELVDTILSRLEDSAFNRQPSTPLPVPVC